MKYSKGYFYVLVLILLPWQSIAQNSKPVNRTSHILLSLGKKQQDSITVVLDSLDIITVTMSTKRSVNFSVLDSSRQIIYEQLVKSRELKWTKKINKSETYTLKLESVVLLLPTEVDMTISLDRPNFSYSDGLPNIDSLVSKAKSDTLIESAFKITKANPKTYEYLFEKGDTLKFELIPVSSKTPTIKITNELQELVFASTPKKEVVKDMIPVLESGNYTLSLVSKAFLGRKNKLTIVKKTPVKYMKKEAIIEQIDSVDTSEPSYDTIPELYMDTVIYLGAGRDIINPSSDTLYIKFENTETIAYWAILFGTGNEFLKGVQDYEPLLEGEALAVGATDVLLAYGLGYLQKLPSQGSGQVSFDCSDFIKWNLNRPIRSNYAKIPIIGKTHFLTYKNESQSTAHNVYVKIALFRKESK